MSITKTKRKKFDKDFKSCLAFSCSDIYKEIYDKIFYDLGQYGEIKIHVKATRKRIKGRGCKNAISSKRNNGIRKKKPI